ncbi:MAG: helix-turn-helix transcriptional regulator [Rickettsiaceae bacterium]|nr:helix-turn-helix transcriptional regulator [Rickettsiaceae bacterium]
MINKMFGKAIRKKRLFMGISQEELAHKSGLHRTYIGAIERGEKNISLKNMEKLINALETSFIDVFLEVQKHIENENNER